jgi:hypothetical protein
MSPRSPEMMRPRGRLHPSRAPGRARAIRRTAMLACIPLLVACVVAVGGASAAVARHPGSALRSTDRADRAHEAGGVPYPNINSVMPPFQTAIRVAAVAGHPGELKLLEVIIRNPARYENATVACDTCRWQDDGFVAHGGLLIDEIRPGRVITKRTHLVIDAEALGAVGRYRLYSVRPRPRNRSTIPEMAQGCIPSNGWLSFLNYRIRPQPSVFTPASLLRTQPTTPCSFSVPTGDSLRIAGPVARSGATAEATLSGTTSGPRMLTLTVEPKPGLCPSTPLGDVWPGSTSQIALVTEVNGPFERQVSVKWRQKSASGGYCAFLQTLGEYHGTPDGYLTSVAIADGALMTLE